jgi:nicotinate-nucleotide adenylyltransferase
MSDGRSRSRFGVLGGTFNPIHLGHLRAAQEAYEALALEEVRFVPSRIPPHKTTAEAGGATADETTAGAAGGTHGTSGARGVDPIAPAEQRVAWVERAVETVDHFSVDRIELDREGPSYLVDTLDRLRERQGESRPVFIVGEDAFAEMGEWRAPERIFALADLAVLTRPPGHLEKLAQRIPRVVEGAFEFDPDGRRARHREAGTTIELVSITALDISSSAIRKACREGRSIRFLVPESVRASIEESGAYGPRPEGRV